MKRFLTWFTAGVFALSLSVQAKDYLVFEGKSGPGLGRHIVFLSGDEEYRSEESLPQMAKILAERHGFKCTVLFAIDPAKGTIDPKITTNLPGAEALDSADAIVMALRFRADSTFRRRLPRGRPQRPQRYTRALTDLRNASRGRGCHGQLGARQNSLRCKASANNRRG